MRFLGLAFLLGLFSSQLALGDSIYDKWLEADKARIAFAYSEQRRGILEEQGLWCTSLNEGEDPDTWHDNYVCITPPYDLEFSTHGAVEGKNCVNLNEPSEDPDSTWFDNYLCTSSPYLRLRWSYNGRLDGYKCVSFNEGEEDEDHTWFDNYLCWGVSNVVKSAMKNAKSLDDYVIRGEPKDQDSCNDRRDLRLLVDERFEQFLAERIDVAQLYREISERSKQMDCTSSFAEALHFLSYRVRVRRISILNRIHATGSFEVSAGEQRFLDAFAPQVPPCLASAGLKAPSTRQLLEEQHAMLLPYYRALARQTIVPRTDGSWDFSNSRLMVPEDFQGGAGAQLRTAFSLFFGQLVSRAISDPKRQFPLYLSDEWIVPPAKGAHLFNYRIVSPETYERVMNGIVNNFVKHFPEWSHRIHATSNLREQMKGFWRDLDEAGDSQVNVAARGIEQLIRRYTIQLSQLGMPFYVLFDFYQAVQDGYELQNEAMQALNNEAFYTQLKALASPVAVFFPTTIVASVLWVGGVLPMSISTTSAAIFTQENFEDAYSRNAYGFGSQALGAVPFVALLPSTISLGAGITGRLAAATTSLSAASVAAYAEWALVTSVAIAYVSYTLPEASEKASELVERFRRVYEMSSNGSNPEEVHREFQSSLEHALSLGVDITFLSLAATSLAKNMQAITKSCFPPNSGGLSSTVAKGPPSTGPPSGSGSGTTTVSSGSSASSSGKPTATLSTSAPSTQGGVMVVEPIPKAKNWIPVPRSYPLRPLAGPVAVAGPNAYKMPTTLEPLQWTVPSAGSVANLPSAFMPIINLDPFQHTKDPDTSSGPFAPLIEDYRVRPYLIGVPDALTDLSNIKFLDDFEEALRRKREELGRKIRTNEITIREATEELAQWKRAYEKAHGWFIPDSWLGMPTDLGNRQLMPPAYKTIVDRGSLSDSEESNGWVDFAGLGLNQWYVHPFAGPIQILWKDSENKYSLVRTVDGLVAWIEPPEGYVAFARIGTNAARELLQGLRIDRTSWLNPLLRDASLVDGDLIALTQALFGRELEGIERDALLRAHNVGKGEPGPSHHLGPDGQPLPAGIGNYTTVQISEKIRILSSQFQKTDWKLILWAGLAGSSEPELSPDSEIYQVPDINEIEPKQMHEVLAKYKLTQEFVTKSWWGQVETAAQIIEQSGRDPIIILGRDGETFYHIIRFLAKDDPAVMSRVYLLNVSRGNVGHRGLLPYLEEKTGLSLQSLAAGNRYWVIDPGGIQGGLADEMNRSLGLTNKYIDQNPGVEKNLRTRFFISIVPHRFGSSAVYFTTLDPKNAHRYPKHVVAGEDHERIPKFTRKSTSFQQIDGRWEAICEVDVSRMTEAKADALKYLRSLAFFLSDPTVSEHFNQRRALWRSILSGDPVHELRSLLDNQPTDPMVHAIARDFLEFSSLYMGEEIPLVELGFSDEVGISKGRLFEEPKPVEGVRDSVSAIVMYPLIEIPKAIEAGRWNDLIDMIPHARSLQTISILSRSLLHLPDSPEIQSVKATILENADKIRALVPEQHRQLPIVDDIIHVRPTAHGRLVQRGWALFYRYFPFAR